MDALKLANTMLFLSTLSLRRATVVDNIVLMPGKFLSTLSLRRATRSRPRKAGHSEISIHALLAESDWLEIFLYYQDNKFLSTLSLRRATTAELEMPKISRFLSTLSLRRATDSRPVRSGHDPDFYPRSPCGERLNGLRHKWASFYFYPRSPCGERPIQHT